MKLIEAIKVIEERERTGYKAAKDMQKTIAVVRQTNEIKNNIVPVRTYLLQEDIIALKKKTREPSIMGAISKAVDYYLKFGEGE